MENPEQHIKEAFQECAKVRKGKAELYGHSWRLANYYTLVNIIYYKAKAAIEKPWDYNTRKEAFIATYNYAIFALIQSEIGTCNLYDLYNEGDRVTEDVEKMNEEIKATLTYKDKGYKSAWINCDFDYLFELILIKIARIQHLREAIQGSDDISREEAALKDAFVDIAGYAILCLARIFRETATDGE